MMCCRWKLFVRASTKAREELDANRLGDRKSQENVMQGKNPVQQINKDCHSLAAAPSSPSSIIVFRLMSAAKPRIFSSSDVVRVLCVSGCMSTSIVRPSCVIQSRAKKEKRYSCGQRTDDINSVRVEPARLRMNEWIQQTTHSSIPDLSTRSHLRIACPPYDSYSNTTLRGRNFAFIHAYRNMKTKVEAI